MQIFSQTSTLADRRRSERGAALVTTLLLATLLLAVGGTLVVTTGMYATNAIDSTAEMQAYYGAEAGLQAALNAFRGNVQPTITFRGAVEPSTSNATSDPATTSGVARMSKWFDYANETSAYPSNVSLNGAIAYRIAVRDPDASKSVSYSTVGSFNEGPSSLTFGTSPNTAIITFTPQSSTTLTAYPAVANQPLGTFVVTVPAGSGGATVPNGTKFRLIVNQTLPWTGNNSFYGTVSGSTGTSIKIDFGSSGNKMGVEGTTYELCSTCNPITLAAPGVNKSMTATITAPEPKRVVIQSTGLGPKGAQKILEMAIDRSRFEIKPPAAIVIRGADPRKVLGVDVWDPMTFDLGSSAAHLVTGVDSDNQEAPKPSVAISLHDWTKGDTGIKKGSTVDDPELSILNIDAPLPSPWPLTLTPVPGTGGIDTPPVVETPDFLKTTEKARLFVASLKKDAGLIKRVFNGFDGTANSDGTTTGKPIMTFVEGDCELDGGSGMLVVTGNLQLKGNRVFDGVILVLGGGSVTRKGGGGGNIFGSWIVARFGSSGDFLAPTFDVSGGGGSEFRYSSEWVKKANSTTGLEVLGIAERNP